MEIKLFEKVIIEYSYGINLDLIIDKFRVSEKDFTRIRKQTFSNTLLFMMNFLNGRNIHVIFHVMFM